MCGIAGLFYLNGQPGDQRPLASMMSAMGHRGPDDEGLAVFAGDATAPRLMGGPATPTSVFDTPTAYRPQGNHGTDPVPAGVLGLGHRRLSILDLSPGGHQPQCTPDGRYWLVFNGEIYNFKEIRDDLEARGIGFQTSGDTEVLLHAYALWGPAALDRCNGMYAMAIWDNVDRRLFLARDRVGIKPLHYIVHPDKLLFASEINGLLASGLHKAEIDPNGLYHSLSLSLAPRPLTAFKGVQGLQQGHWMMVDEHGVQAPRQYWQIPTGVIDRNRSEESFAEELEQRLHRAVDLRLVADVPVGTFMSGGIDSTLVSSIAANHHPGIKAFTLAYDEASGMDELPEAKATAEMWPMEHVIWQTQHDFSIVHEPEMVRAQIEPTYSISPVYVISRLAVQSGVTVVLSGLGGDELFGGYGRANQLALWRKARRYRHLLAPLPEVRGVRAYKAFTNQPTLVDYYAALFGFRTRAQREKLLHPDLLAQVTEREDGRLFRQLYDIPLDRFEEDLEALSYMDILHYVGNHFMHRQDHLNMVFSLEGRFPMLDHELIEFAMTIPGKYKVKNGVGKQILRKVAAKYIHPSCLEMKKKGFGLPMRQYMNGPLKEFVIEKLDGLEGAGVYRGSALSVARKELLNDRFTWTRLWQLVSTRMWMENFGMGK